MVLKVSGDLIDALMVVAPFQYLIADCDKRVWFKMFIGQGIAKKARANAGG